MSANEVRTPSVLDVILEVVNAPGMVRVLELSLFAHPLPLDEPTRRLGARSVRRRTVLAVLTFLNSR
jgi:hypothetical protein